MNTLHVKKDDTVVILSGKDKGKKGKVLEVSPSERKVIVEGCNMVTKHVKPRRMGEPGGIVKAEGALYAPRLWLSAPSAASLHAPPINSWPTERKLESAKTPAAAKRSKEEEKTWLD